MSSTNRRLGPARWLALAPILLIAALLFAACDGGDAETPTTTAPTATQQATTEPTSEATPEATAEPTSAPTVEPTAEPTSEATAEPTSAPTVGPTAEPTSPPATETPTASAAAVQLADGGELGEILVDADGMTLYIFDNDEEGVSNCSGGCLENWPPLIIEGEPEAGDDVTATLGTITRDDGTMQVTVNGYPAYYWQGDTAAGDTAGHGVGGNWWVFGADGEPLRPAKVGLFEHSELGQILVDGNGMTLYIFDNDEEGVSNCSGDCLENWPPLLTEYEPAALSDVTATLGTITRDDGTMQVTVNGWPAYFWQGDAAEGDATGQGVGDVWWVFGPDGTAIRN